MNLKTFTHLVAGFALKIAFLVLPVEIKPAHARFEQCSPPADFCTPFIGCIEETGEIFRGQTRGQESGPLIAVSSYGATCSGTWRRTFLGVGVAQFKCDDGRSGTSIYTYFEKSSGTAVGEAKMTNGQVGRFWSGWNLEAYFNEVAPEERLRMACEVKELLLG